MQASSLNLALEHLPYHDSGIDCCRVTGLLQDVLACIKRTYDTCITWCRNRVLLSELYLGLDQWRPQSGSDLPLHKRFETVVFEKFALQGKNAKENKITNKRVVPKANVVCKQFSGWCLIGFHSQRRPFFQPPLKPPNNPISPQLVGGERVQTEG